jgi:hypothetical protein
LKKITVYDKVIVVIALIGISISLYCHDRKTKNYIIAILKEFPAISYNTAYSGNVINIDQEDKTLVRNNTNSILILLKDTIKLSITTGSEPTTDSNLQDVIKIGSRIFKKEQSDTLYIFNVSNHDTIRNTFIIQNESVYRRKYLKK